MKRKFNILCIILAAATIFGWVVDCATERKSFSVSFNQGREDAREFDTDGNGHMTTSMNKDDWYYADVVAKDYHIVTDSIYNHKTGKHDQMILEEVNIRTTPKTAAEQKAYDIVGPLTAIAYLACMGYFWLMLILSIISVNKDELFSKNLESRFTRMGVCLIIAYASQWILEIFGYYWTRNHISLDYYDIVIDGPNCYFLCFGIGMIIVAELFKIARAYREENEMTI